MRVVVCKCRPLRVDDGGYISNGDRAKLFQVVEEVGGLRVSGQVGGSV